MDFFRLAFTHESRRPHYINSGPKFDSATPECTYPLTGDHANVSYGRSKLECCARARRVASLRIQNLRYQLSLAVYGQITKCFQVSQVG